MAIISELFRGEPNGSVSFGDYTLNQKTKKDNIDFGGDIYKIKTFFEITKLEKNGAFVYESVPGTAVENFAVKEDGITFTVEGYRDCEITVELEESTQYVISFDGEQHGLMETNRSGKLSMGLSLEEGKTVAVSIQKR